MTGFQAAHFFSPPPPASVPCFGTWQQVIVTFPGFWLSLLGDGREKWQASKWNAAGCVHSCAIVSNPSLVSFPPLSSFQTLMVTASLACSYHSHCQAHRGRNWVDFERLHIHSSETEDGHLSACPAKCGVIEKDKKMTSSRYMIEQAKCFLGISLCI